MKFFNLKTLGLFLLGALLTFNSCDKPTTTTTVEEDKESIDDFSQRLLDETQALKDGCGITTIDDFFNINNGSALNQSWVDQIGTSLESHLNLAYIDQNKLFLPSNHYGTHSYAGSQNWTQTSAPTDKVVVEMPALQGATNNSIMATLNSYTDQTVTIDGSQYKLPSAFDLNIKKSGADCIGFLLKSASYESGSFQIPTSAEFDLIMSPHTFNVNVTKNSPTEFNVKITAFNSGSEAFSINTDVILKNSDYESFDIDDDVKSFAGEFKIGDISIVYTANIEGAQNLLSPTPNQINSLYTAELQNNGTKIADLFYQENSNGETEIMIEYKDGTIEDTESIYTDFIDQLEIIVVGLTGSFGF
jgi:hypothetical protein